MSKQKKHIQEEPFFTRAAVDNATIVESDSERSFEVVFATETPVFRRGWEENFNEILSCDPQHIRTNRIADGVVPLLDNHDRYSGVSKQMGRVDSFKIEKNECRAKIIFSTRSEFDGIWSDIKAGIIRSISTGYQVYKFLREVVTDNTVPNYRAIDWEPLEISLAPVPADYKSKIRNQESAGHEIVIENFLNTRDMEDQNKPGATNPPAPPAPGAETRSVENPPAPPVNVEEVRRQAETAERQRVQDITKAVRAANLDQAFADDLINRGVSIGDARTAIIDKLAETQGTPNVRTAAPAAHITVDESENTRSAMSDALLCRAIPGAVKLEGKAHDFKHMSMLDMARHMLELKGEKPYAYSKNELVKRAISTTDYADLLNSTVERSIRRTYDAMNPEWKQIARQISAPDFRQKTGIAVDGKITFAEIAEGGEYTESKLITDDKASIKLKTFGRKITITRQAIINDDMGVFDKLPQMLALGAQNFQADKVWGLILQNAKTPDGKAIFHADHNNLGTGAGNVGAPSEALLSKARNAMWRQKTPAGEFMPIAPEWIIVPVELLTATEKLLSGIVANTTGDVNVFANKFKIMTNPRLVSPTEWYMAANPQTVEGLVYAYLEGSEGLYTEKEVDFNTDAVVTKARLDFDAAIWDYRGWYKNLGA